MIAFDLASLSFGTSLLQRLEVFGNFSLMVYGGCYALKASLNKFPVPVTNLSVTQMVLQRVDVLHIANRSA